MAKPRLPSQFESWEEARDYYAAEAVFLMQLADRHPSRRAEERARKASERAIAANRQCEQPYPEEERGSAAREAEDGGR